MDYHKLVNIFHILVVAPLFFYLAIYKNHSYKPLVESLFYIGIFILCYHLYKLYRKITANIQSIWINLLHILIVAPLLIYIGFYKGNVPRMVFEVLLMLGFASLGYHLYYLVF